MLGMVRHKEANSATTLQPAQREGAWQSRRKGKSIFWCDMIFLWSN